MKKSIKKIIKYTLKKLAMDSEEARALIFATGNAESGYRVLEQIGGPAIGFFQVEPNTIADVWDNYVFYRPEIKTDLWSLGFDESNMSGSVMASIALQVAFARLQYKRDPNKLPDMGNKAAMAEYWKRVYNTELGRGTVKHFLEANKGL
jgi:hypothetical protein